MSDVQDFAVSLDLKIGYAYIKLSKNGIKLYRIILLWEQ